MDEKTRRDSAFYNQRRRWLSAQVHSLASGIKDLPGAVLSGNIDYCDKLLQWMMPPRIILLGLVPAFGLLMLLTDPRASVKWWALLLALLLAMAMAIPDYLVDKRFKRAMHKIPCYVRLDGRQHIPYRRQQKQIHTHRTRRRHAARTENRNMKMRIAIEAQRIFRQKKHGMDFVALETIRRLQAMDTDNEYFIMVAPGPDHCLEESPNVRIVEVKCPTYPLWEQAALPLALKKIKPDILHCTSNTAPVFCNTPLILTLHDIIFIENDRDKTNPPTRTQDAYTAEW